MAQPVRTKKGGAGGRFVGLEVDGLSQFLNAASRQLGPEFNRQLRVAGEQLSKTVVAATQGAASSHPSPKLYAEVVRRALRARRDRYPTIKLSESLSLQLSRTSGKGSKGKTKVKAGEVWYGAEFGGGARKTTRQFPPHLGRQGYVFFPTVRRMAPRINQDYLTAVDRVLAQMSGGPTS